MTKPKPETGHFKIRVTSDNPADQIAEVVQKMDGALLKFKKQRQVKAGPQFEQSLRLRSVDGRTLTYTLELREWEGMTVSGLGRIVNIHQWADCKSLMDERVENKKQKQAKSGQ